MVYSLRFVIEVQFARIEDLILILLLNGHGLENRINDLA